MKFSHLRFMNFDRRNPFAPGSNFLSLSSSKRERLGRACSPPAPLNSPPALNFILLSSFFTFWITKKYYVLFLNLFASQY